MAQTIHVGRDLQDWRIRGDGTVKFVLFVEGHTERKAIPSFLKRWLDPLLNQNVGIQPVRFEGWSEFRKKIARSASMHLNSPDSANNWCNWPTGSIWTRFLSGPYFVDTGSTRLGCCSLPSGGRPSQVQNVFRRPRDRGVDSEPTAVASSLHSKWITRKDCTARVGEL